MTDSELKKLEWIGMDDGYGIVGVSFYCPYCDHFNTFVCPDAGEHDCEKCCETLIADEEYIY